MERNHPLGVIRDGGGASIIIRYMNIVWAALIVLVTAGIAVAAMLFVRSRAPEGSYFADSDRAAGIFGVIATGFSVLLGFLIFLGFESYDASRTGAETEALTIAQQVQTAQFFPDESSAQLTGELVCYARYVINVEWDQMENGSLGEELNPWGVAMFRTLRAVELDTPQQESAYDQWLEQTSAREIGRQDRIHGAAGVMPTPLWIALFFISAIVLVVPVRVRRQQRASVGAGAVHGRRGLGRRHDAVAARLPRRPVPGQRRRPSARGDGTQRADHRPGTRSDRHLDHDPV